MDKTMEEKIAKQEDKKYTVKEVLESLYWENTDADEDYDGYLHVVSTINGREIKISLKEILKSQEKAIQLSVAKEIFDEIIGTAKALITNEQYWLSSIDIKRIESKYLTPSDGDKEEKSKGLESERVKKEEGK